MCVIISRKPGIVIPFEKIESACHVNSDGYGFSILDRGKIETVKDYTAKGNDPETVAKVLNEQAKDLHVYLHLRFTTKGAKDEGNCHPFQLSSYKDDGQDVWFMHNGTLYDFSDSKSDRSDSYLFAQQLASPLMRTFLRGSQEAVSIHDPCFIQIMTHYAKSNSVFLIYDDEGNQQIIDPSKNGKWFDDNGWWASNEYSFNRYHREKKTYDTGYTGGNWYQKWESDGYVQGPTGVWSKSTTQTKKDNDEKGTSVVPFAAAQGQSQSPTSSSTSSASSTPLETQAGLIGSAVNQYKAMQNRKPPDHTPPTKRFTFCELAGFHELIDVCQLSEEEIEDMVTDAPEAASLLILDLIYELWTQQRQANARKAAGGTN